MSKKLTDVLNVSLCAVLIFQLAGCGTILYPERKGQKGGKIDTSVALLDGLGLLLFLVPGIIAFAVDFNNGTIYLPGTALGPNGLDDIRQVKFDPKTSTPASIERTIKEETGHTLRWDQPDMKISKLGSTEDMLDRFAQTIPQLQDNDMASNH